MRPITVFLVDDNRTFLQALTRYLQEEGRGEVEVVGSASSGPEVIARAAAARPEVILLDLKMPDMSGVNLLPRLRGASRRAIIVVLTMADDEEVRRGMLALGANGFVSKANIARDLLPTIRELISAKRGTRQAGPG